MRNWVEQEPEVQKYQGLRLLNDEKSEKLKIIRGTTLLEINLHEHWEAKNNYTDIQ